MQTGLWLSNNHLFVLLYYYTFII